MTLEEWETHWELNGDHLHCINCRIAQWPFNAAQPFPHASSCTRSGEVEFPWRELARIVAATRLPDGP